MELRRIKQQNKLAEVKAETLSKFHVELKIDHNHYFSFYLELNIKWNLENIY